jgi:5-deoxy-glucuronate isomerase
MSVHATPESAGWGYSGLRVVEMDVCSAVTDDAGPDETIVAPLGERRAGDWASPPP